MTDQAQRFYEIFAAALGSNDATGTGIVAWADVAPEVQQAWQAVADAARRDIEQALSNEYRSAHTGDANAD
jgi:hypothetical protein